MECEGVVRKMIIKKFIGEKKAWMERIFNQNLNSIIVNQFWWKVGGTRATSAHLLLNASPWNSTSIPVLASTRAINPLHNLNPNLITRQSVDSNWPINKNKFAKKSFERWAASDFHETRIKSCFFYLAVFDRLALFCCPFRFHLPASCTSEIS